MPIGCALSMVANPCIRQLALVGLILIRQAVGLASKPASLELNYATQPSLLSFQRTLHSDASGESNCYVPVHGSERMLNSEEAYKVAVTNWRALRKNKAPSKSMPTKLAFIMLVYERMVFPKTWEEFLKSASPGSYTMLIHAKGTNPHLTPFFEKFLLKKRYKSEWCNSVWLLTSLYRHVLADKHVTHLAVVSGDSLPLRSMSEISSTLHDNDHSKFCVDEEWTRAETWNVIRRDHAELIDKNRDTYHELLLTRHVSCVDEDSLWWALRERDEDVMDQCTTMVDWSGTHKNWKRNAEECRCPSFIASEKDPASCSNPAVMRVVTSEGMEELLESSRQYWFVRKFPGDAIDGQAKYLMNGTEVPLDSVMAHRYRRVSRLSVAPRGLLNVAPELPPSGA